ncbi:uncharacterized protein LOC135485246 [Lineus longissimus]|uniref:uncharacterized protein LOC135485246 n=1 Tax=Lineus longissimus TaxID=88925 RepID=UPI002B4E5029
MFSKMAATNTSDEHGLVDDDNELVSGMDELDGLFDEVPDPDTHDKKGTLVKGLLNISLITSNVSQLKTLVFATDRGKYLALWVSLVIMIIISLILQLVVGGMWFYIYNVSIFAKTEPMDSAMTGNADYVRYYKEEVKKKRASIHQALLLLNATAVIVMVITVLNMIISAMGWT